MEKFLVTKIVSKLGYYVMGAGTVLLCAIIGFAMSGFLGFLLGILAGCVVSVPLLLACEFSYAIVKIAENTDPKRNPESTHQRAA